MGIGKWFSQLAGRSGQAAAPDLVGPAPLTAEERLRVFRPSNRSKVCVLLGEYEKIHQQVEDQIQEWKFGSREGAYAQAYLCLMYGMVQDVYHLAPKGLITNSALIFETLSKGGQREQWMQNHFDCLTQVVDRLGPVRHTLRGDKEPLLRLYPDSFRCAQLAVLEAFKPGVADRVDWESFEPIAEIKSALLDPPGVRTVPIPDFLLPKAGPRFLPPGCFKD